MNKITVVLDNGATLKVDNGVSLTIRPGWVRVAFYRAVARPHHLAENLRWDPDRTNTDWWWLIPLKHVLWIAEDRFGT
jgi:hypothetical protein